MNHWTLEGSDGQPIFGTTHVPAGEPAGALLICHGFKGYKDYGLFPHLAEAAAGAGLMAHRFNFSHSGMTRNVETFERPDLFEKDTWGRQIADLHAVASAVMGGELPGEGLGQVWFGHSRGGVTALLAAARAFAGRGALPVRPVGVATASSPDRACNLSEAACEELREEGRLASPSGRTGQTLHIGGAWLAEIEAKPEAFDPLAAARVLACPLLVLHGSEDDTVDASAARRLAEAAGDGVALEIVEGASHTFNCPNPLPMDEAPPAETQRLIERVTGFAVARCGG
ncbi:MAG: alpha/beta hydrolase [Phycisphaeraceae bacterium]